MGEVEKRGRAAAVFHAFIATLILKEFLNWISAYIKSSAIYLLVFHISVYLVYLSEGYTYF